MTLKRSVAHYFQRIRELGPIGTINRIRVRSKDNIILWSQSLWWGLRVRHKMSDTNLLAQTTGEWDSVEDLLDHLANRPSTSYVLPHESPQETVKFLESYYSGYVSELLNKADAVCLNEINLLGQEFKFTNRIDWNCDPVTGWHWPVWFRGRINGFLYSPKWPVDPIFTWELNRHQHFITLGIAYWLTNDQKYVDTLITQIGQWINTNPVQHGINWYYPLETSIRLISWIVTFQFIRTSKKFKQEIGKEFLKSMWQHVDFIKNHLQITRCGYPNNHMIAELTSLVLIGITFPEFISSVLWREDGLRLLNQQAIAQTHLDGVNKEQATGYHRFVTELLLLVVSRSRRGGLKLETQLETTLEGMLDYILYSISPNGMSPMWGDSDYGCALGMGINQPFQDFRPILSAGAAIFNHADWKFKAERFDVEAFWLLGFDGLANWEKLDVRQPNQTSKDFPKAGLYIIRDNWATNTDLAMFRCGPFGLGGDGYCAHAHADMLSLTLWLNGKPVLIDSGTYIYHGPWRDPFRLTAAHNTVKIDDREQAIPIQNFNWREVPEGKCIDWTGKSVTGAMSYNGEVNLVRKLSHPQPGYWELVDVFSWQDNKHKISWFFHLSAGLTWCWDNVNQLIIIEKDNKPFVNVFTPNDVNLEVKSEWCSDSYGKKHFISVLQATWSGKILSSTQKFLWKFTKV